MHICICICTYQRAQLLKRLLDSLATQETGDLFTFSIVVADNDEAKSAESTVVEFSKTTAVPVSYQVEPRRNIALARNTSIAHATGDFIAFIDDDEFPSPTWLQQLLRTCLAANVAGVLGPVRPHFDQAPPVWVIRGRFCERAEHPTGTVLDWNQCRSGNVLFRCDILPAGQPPFHERFGAGGEDKDFFLRMTQLGHVFVWCNEAAVYETVPPSRLTRRFMIERALLRGTSNSLLSSGRLKLIMVSLVAAPIYALVLPFSLLLGQHRFMDCLIRFCDHFGRLLAIVGLNPVQQRQM